VPLLAERAFALDTDAVLAAWIPDCKLVFLCSPNNPTGALLEQAAIETICEQLSNQALVVVDEAYVEFARGESFAAQLDRFPNLVVLRTLSKAYALAGARCGALLAHPDIVSLLANVITPYALPTQTIEAVLKFTDREHRAAAAQRIVTILSERARLSEQLLRLPLVRRVWKSDANFLLIECVDTQRVLGAAKAAGLIIREPSSPALAQCLRISVGTPEQNDRLLRGIARAAGAAA
jgi:histidinol-phosphate aminotransferase